MAYDYMKAMLDDIREYIDSEINLTDWAGDADGLYEHLYDTLWADDSVTGNGSGSYTFNRYQAEENLCHNLDILAEVISEFGCSWDILEDPEAADVSIRCYLLGQALAEVLEEYDIEELEDDISIDACEVA